MWFPVDVNMCFILMSFLHVPGSIDGQDGVIVTQHTAPPGGKRPKSFVPKQAKVLSINSVDARCITHEDATKLLRRSADSVDLCVRVELTQADVKKSKKSKKAR